MNASLRIMFDVSMKQYNDDNRKKEDSIDFDRDITYGFPCLNKLYNFSYTNKGLTVKIETSL